LLVVSLDNTILNVALPTLVRALHASASDLQWIVDAFTIVYAGMVITAGSLGDRFGRRGALLVGLAVFGVGSGLSAFSTSPGELIGFRFLMGLGGAFVLPSTLSILTNVFSNPRERGKAIGIWSGTSGLGIAIGPIVGGWLLAHFWWGSVFLVNVPIVVLGLVAITLLVPDSADPSPRRPDPVGTVLSIAGLTVLLYGVIQAPVDGWGSAPVVAAVLGGLATLAGFVAWEIHCDHPMLRMEFFADRRFSAAGVSVMLVFFSLFGAMFLLTQYLQSVLGYDALQAGLRIAPVALVLGVAAPASAVLARHLGTKVVVVAGLVSVTIGLLLLTDLSPSSGYTPVLIAIMILGLGIGLALAPATDSMMGSLPGAQAGVGSAINSTMIEVGGALGVGILGSILNARYRGKVTAGLKGHAVPPVALHAIESSLGGALVVARMVGGSSGRLLTELARSSFTSGVNLADMVGVAVAMLGALVAVAFLPQRGRNS